MRSVNQELLDALKAGDVKATKAGLTAVRNGLIWADMSMNEALSCGYVERTEEQQAKEEARVAEFRSLLSGHDNDPEDGDYD